MWTISCVLVIVLNFNMAYGEICVCTKQSAFVYLEYESLSPKMRRIYKNECFTVHSYQHNGKRIGIFSDEEIGFVSVDDVEVTTCTNLANEPKRGQSRRFLVSCNKKRCPAYCICEHFFDYVTYVKEHQECHACFGCTWKNMDCSAYYVHTGNEENRVSQVAKQTTTLTRAITSKQTTTFTRPITSDPATTISSKVEHKCNKLAIIHALAEETYNKNRTCTLEPEAGSELFLKHQCNATKETSKWILNRRITTICEENPPIPSYTAVGSMADGIYGSFIGCFTKDNGDKELRIATQFCGRPAEIIHIPDPAQIRNFGSVENYFTIAW